MKSIRSICSLVLLAAAVIVVIAGCPPKQASVTEAERPAAAPADSLRFDPFELPQDRENVPAMYPVNAAVTGRETIESEKAVPMAADSAEAEVETGVPTEVDTLNHQAFRIQIFTTKLYGEAQHTKRIAEEIFDRPVYLDYEVPYYKVRVGSFADRYEAEDYAQRVRAAGYPDAWVAATTVSIRQAAPLYEDAPLPPSGDSTAVPDTTGGQEPGDGE